MSRCSAATSTSMLARNSTRVLFLCCSSLPAAADTAAWAVSLRMCPASPPPGLSVKYGAASCLPSRAILTCTTDLQHRATKCAKKAVSWLATSAARSVTSWSSLPASCCRGRSPDWVARTYGDTQREPNTRASHVLMSQSGRVSVAQSWLSLTTARSLPRAMVCVASNRIDTAPASLKYTSGRTGPTMSSTMNLGSSSVFTKNSTFDCPS